MIEDVELIRRFREQGSDEAFAQIVDRYVNMVYSVAFRQLGESEHLARDVCQDVFVSLARKIETLRPEVILSGWLYRSTLFAAKDLRRREQRRRKRETLAMLEFDSNEGDYVNWESVRPALDEAICNLAEKDRDAVCMRYFQNLSYAKIGEQLNLTENASRMRVERALEKLNGLLSRKKTGITVVALAAALGGQSALAAPAGLSAIVSQVATASLVSGTGGSAIGVVINFMNTSKLTTAVAVLISSVSVGVALYQTQELEAAKFELSTRVSYEVLNTNEGEDLNALRSRLAGLDVTLSQLSLPATVADSSHGFSIEEFEDELEEWTMKVDRIAAYLELNESFWIPELELLTLEDWLDGAKHAILHNEADFRRSLSHLRSAAKHKLLPVIKKALDAYTKNNDGKFPTDAMDLLEYADATLDPAILKRYYVSQAGDHPFIGHVSGESVLIEDGSVDPVWDTQFYVSERGILGHRYMPDLRLSINVMKAMSAFRAESNRDANSLEDLASYFDSEEGIEIRADVFEAMTNNPDVFLDQEKGK